MIGLNSFYGPSSSEESRVLKHTWLCIFVRFVTRNRTVRGGKTEDFSVAYSLLGRKDFLNSYFSLKMSANLHRSLVGIEMILPFFLKFIQLEKEVTVLG